MTNEISLIEATKADLPRIREIEQGEDTREFIRSDSLKEHEKAIATPGITYLGIVREKCLVGFFILVQEPDRASVEFRRIAISKSARGIGQQAIVMMEAYCRSVLECQRIWLDVLPHNLRAKHIYEKLGYKPITGTTVENPELLLYEKYLFP